MKKTILICLTLITGIVNAQTTILSAGSSWKYLDNGTDQGTTWRDSSFNDASWSSGNAQHGYGEGDETTLLNYGGVPSNKYTTYYFRKKININTSAFINYTLNLKRDDGAIVYLNGNEVWRENMPAGTITYATFAASDASDDGQTFLNNTIPSTYFINGDNYICIEVHQFTLSSSDVSFDFSLIGNNVPPAPVLVRGPYLQQPTSNSMIVRWRTDINSPSKVQYGTSTGSLTFAVVDSTPKTEHIITVTGLSSNTKYFYSVGDYTNVLQGDANNYFTTSPLQGTNINTRLWFIGDHGTADQSPRNMRDAFLTYTGSRRADLMFMLGDNAYANGTDAEYQVSTFQNQLEGVIKNVPLLPCAGNHDLDVASATNQTGPYFDIFSMFTSAQGGGLASGTEAYYSFNYGQIHFVCLESTTASFRQMNSPMMQWLQSDLAANTQKWTIVYWHHPPHSKGTHDSDADIEEIEMRQNFAPIIEQYKVDLVLSGNSHSYERSMYINGHYGLSNTFNSTHKVDSTSGSIAAPYLKQSSKQYKGTVYIQVGCSGVPEPITNGGWPHPAMSSAIKDSLGSMIIDVDGDSLIGRFINGSPSNPLVLDEFKIVRQCNLSASINPVPNQCPSGAPVTLSATPSGGIFSGTGVSGNSFSPITAGIGVHTVTYNYSDGICSTSTSIQITVAPPQITAPSTNICAGSNVAMTASSGTNYQWYRNSVLLSGATNQTYLASSNGTYYCRIVTPNCTANSNNLILTVVNNPTPSITAGSPTSFCSPGNVTLTANTFAGVTYQWQKNGANISNATNQTYTAINNGSYRVIQTANGCNKTSPAVSVTKATSVSASITAGGPTNFCTGGSVTISLVNPIPGYSYQWKNNGVNISGATLSNYNATASGNYTCFVSASCGNSTSNSITVTVGTINTSVSPSGSVAICSGASVTLNAFSDPGYSYQWQLNGNSISGATLSSYTTSSAGDYSVIITTSCGNATSLITTVTITSVSISISAGGSTNICSGNSVLLSVNNVISGYVYQWKNNGVDITGATATSYSANSSGSYSCSVSGTCGTASSNSISVNVESTTASITPAGTVTVCNGASTTLTANTGIGYSYQWKLGGANISGATNISYSSNVAGSYTVDVTGTCGTVTSSSTTIINSPGAISISPSPSTTFCAGLSFQLTATTGTGYTYQWVRNGINISSATNSTLTSANAGSYTVKITQNGLCTTTSSTTVVTQINNPVPTISPSTAQTICSGSQLTFSTNNFAGVVYQWQKNGIDISGATLQNYNATTSGTHRVRQTANGCTKSSASVSLNVIACSFHPGGKGNNTTLSGEFKFAPNPFENTSYLFIPFEYFNAPVNVFVYDALGKVSRMSVTRSSGKFVVNRNDATSGIYFLQVKDGSNNSLYVTKIVLE
ncbi:MAG TPA: metallophosphoesterase [Bacteroidia bacterium]|nr:metallophosphoesterase [Bacteroidia bacterium]HNU33610.1 metallophosphoesterase [Bacteroidia bacterium]